MLERCIEVLKKGKKVIYITPSRELAGYTRQEYMTRLGGLINTDIIVIDELEEACAWDFLGGRTILPEDIGITVLKKVMEDLAYKGKLRFYNRIYNRYGFLKSLIMTIKKIKRQNLPPGELLIKAQDIGNDILIKKAENLEDIYEAYSSKLKELGFVDQEDMARIAAENSDRCAYLNDVGLIAVDGYINLDRTDAELLKSIAQKRHIKIIGHVPMNAPFIDRFTDSEIYKDFEEIGAEIVKYDFSQDCNFSGVAACLFTGERLQGPCSDIRVLNAPCMEDEVRQAAKIIKSLLYEKKTIPEKIAVVANDSEDYGEYIDRIFEEMDLPTSTGRYAKLAAVPLIRDLFALFSAKEDASEKGPALDTPYISMVSGAYFDGTKINDRLREIHLSDRITHYTGEFIKITDELKIKQKLNELYKNGNITSDIFMRDLKAYISLMEILIKAERDYADFDIEISFGDFLEFLKRHMQEATISLKGGNPAGIKILNPDLLKGTVYDYVFFLGLNEGVFPSITAKGGIFTSHEKELLYKSGINLESSGWELAREKIRFILSVASAKTGLFLSYRTAGEDGSYLIKSPFLEELVFTANLDESSAAIMAPRSMRQRFASDLNDIWSLKEAAEKTIYGMSGANAGKSRLTMNREDYEELTAGLRWFPLAEAAHGIEEKRYSCEFTNYDGRIGPEGACKFNGNYYFSPSQLNSFNYCLFRFFVERVLQVAAEDDEEAVHARDKGRLYHDVLRRYYDGFEDATAFSEERLKQKAGEAFECAGLNDDSIAAAVYKYEIIKVLKGFLVRDAAFLSGYCSVTGKLLKPYYLEKSFFDEEFCGFKFCVRVDRVDLEFEGGCPTGRFIIYDYKSKNGKNLKKCLENKDFQLIVYYHLVKKALAEDLNLPAPECISLLYYDIENSRFEGIIVEEERKALGKNRGSIDTISRSNFEYVMDYFKGLAALLIQDIKKGDFILPMECSSASSFSGYECKYRSVCRFDAARVLGKTR